MISELLVLRCGTCNAPLEVPISDPDVFAIAEVEEDGMWRALSLFIGHTAAHRCGTRHGWTCMSESIGGDTCPDCQERYFTLHVRTEGTKIRTERPTAPKRRCAMCGWAATNTVGPPRCEQHKGMK